MKCRVIYPVGAALVLAAALGCAPGSGAADAKDAEPSAAEKHVRAFVEAFNAHDVEAMLALATDDVEWLAVDGQAISVESAGAEALRRGMIGYFEACESCRSELTAVMVAGSRVTTLEVARWDGADGPQRQSGLAVYELDDGLIRRVYYFPVEE